MTTPLLTTKLYIPPTRPKLVPRQRLIEQLNEGLHRKLTLISAPAGFGKTTLVTEWLDNLRLDTKKETQIENKIAWLSLDEGDNDLVRFLSYLIAALNQREELDTTFGKGALIMLQSPQPPPSDAILTSLINEFAEITNKYILVLDDCHLIESQPIHDALDFLIENLPTQMHLVFVTREDPQIPLARIRSQDQLTELRATDLRFTSSEATEFLNSVMGLSLSVEDIAALEMRTEGWVAGLQLAAISMQGQKDVAGFIKSFTGSHRLVLDYLIEEVLEKQPEGVQTFLLQTSILDRLTGSLCDALTSQEDGQVILEYLEQANLFIVPLDNERQWYRYHHLFADLLRHRLHQRINSSSEGNKMDTAELNIRASKWYEENTMEIEAFLHAAAANDFERAERLIEGDGLPLSFRGAVAPVLNWLKSLPAKVLDARPSLWVTYAMTLLAVGQVTGIEEKLQAAESAIHDVEPDESTRDLIGRIADTRGTYAATQRDAETMIAQSLRALEYLHPDNLTYRTATTWKLAYAFEIQGDRAAASKAYSDAISISQTSENIYINIVSTVGLANVQRAENQLQLAAKSYQRTLQLVGDLPIPVAWLAHLCLGHIFYEWNDLETAQQHGKLSLKLARQYIDNRDILGACDAFLARLKLAQGDVAGATKILIEFEEADQSEHEHLYPHHVAELVSVQVLTFLHQGNTGAAEYLAEKHELPLSKARVHIAQGNVLAALAVLENWRNHVEKRGWSDEQLKVIILEVIALDAHGKKEEALQMLGEAMSLAEPGGFIRTFVDEGPAMEALLKRIKVEDGKLKEYVHKLITAFSDKENQPSSPRSQHLIEPLSERELEVLQLVAEGFTNQEIASRLFLSLNTVKAHTRNIYGKLGVNNRTQAAARANDLGVLSSN